jgi:hypothetical protein
MTFCYFFFGDVVRSSIMALVTWFGDGYPFGRRLGVMFSDKVMYGLDGPSGW